MFYFCNWSRVEADDYLWQENSFALKTPVEKGDFINGNIKLKYGEIKVNVPSKLGKIILGICLQCKTGCLGHKLEFSQTDASVFRVKIENVAEKPRKWPLYTASPSSFLRLIYSYPYNWVFLNSISAFCTPPKIQFSIQR